MRARGAEGERWGCVAEVVEPCLPMGILARHQIYEQTQARRAQHNVDDQRSAGRVLRRCTRTYFVEHKYETLSLCFAPPAQLLFYQLAATPSRIARVENEEDDVGLVDDFVQHADVMPPQTSTRTARGRGRWLMRIAASCASEESVGSDAIVASSYGGACGGDWDGDAPRAEEVSMIGKWRQDGGSAAHTERLSSISVLRTLRFGRRGEHTRVFFQFYGATLVTLHERS